MVAVLHDRATVRRSVLLDSANHHHWVVSVATSLPEPGTEHAAASPAEAIFLAQAYREHFKESRIVRIFASPDVSDENLSSLHEKAKSNSFYLEKVGI